MLARSARSLSSTTVSWSRSSESGTVCCSATAATGVGTSEAEAVGAVEEVSSEVSSLFSIGSSSKDSMTAVRRLDPRRDRTISSSFSSSFEISVTTGVAGTGVDVDAVSGTGNGCVRACDFCSSSILARSSAFFRPGGDCERQVKRFMRQLASARASKALKLHLELRNRHAACGRCRKGRKLKISQN